MTIGIDASRSIATIQKTGVEKVSDELIKEIEGNEIKIIYYTPQKISWLPKENQKILHWPFKFFWTQIRLAWELVFHPPKAMFFPVHAMPLVLFFLSFPHSLLSFPPRIPVSQYGAGSVRGKLQRESRNSPTTPSVSAETATPPRAGGDKMRIYKIIHDIAFKKQPHLYSFKQKIILNLDLWLAKKLCVKIFVPSEAVRDDLLKYTKIKPEKIMVTPWGYVQKNYRLRITDYGLRKKQILYIGRVVEKKNVSNLIKAFKIFHEKHPDYKLILAGKIDQKFKTYFCHLDTNQPARRRGGDPEKDFNFFLDSRWSLPRTLIRGGNDNTGVEFLDYIGEEKKIELLRESAALALVSKEEGFGFPILEAFDFSLPVVASDIPVLREIGADACVYVNPDSLEDIARGLETAVVETHCNAFLQKIEKGHERLKKISWQKTAEKILTEILGNKNPS